MKTIQLIRRSVRLQPGTQSYAVDCEITSSQSITRYLFVKQRMINTDKTFHDRYYAVATPEQLEHLDELAPGIGTRLYRSHEFRLINTDLNRLEADFQHLVGELQKLCDTAEVLDEMEADAVYSISAEDIAVNMATQHIHYRLPLTARPCGINEVFTDTDNLQKHRIISADTGLGGWLPCDEQDPGGTLFKYNQATDQAVTAVGLPSADRVAYAHIEINGVVAGKVLINTTGIFWKTNLYGLVPWPRSYVDVNDLGDTVDATTLVLDIIV